MNLFTMLLLPQLAQEPTGSKLGTAIEWEATVDAAAKKARKEEKLLLVLHVAGHFDKPGLT